PGGPVIGIVLSSLILSLAARCSSFSDWLEVSELMSKYIVAIYLSLSPISCPRVTLALGAAPWPKEIIKISNCRKSIIGRQSIESRLAILMRNAWSSCSSCWFCGRLDNHVLKTLGIKTELVAAAERSKLSYIKAAL